jgi:membrane associated rhomboid family serine protease
MFIPLGTDRLPRHRPTVTLGLIGVNLAIFLGIAIAVRAGLTTHEAVLRWGSVWRLDFHPRTLVTSVFLHDPSGLGHIAFNMLFLWVFGQAVETRFGSWWFLVFYLVGGAVACVAHMVASPAPAIGASGAVAGVSGAYLALFPRSRVRVLFVFIVIGLYHIPATWFILFYIAIDLLSQASDILGRPSDVANAAHLGGYLFGFSTSIALLGIGVLPRTDLDALYLLKQRQRRRAMRQVARDHGSAFEGPSTSSPLPDKVRRADATTPSPPDPDAPHRAAIVEALRQDDGATAIRLYDERPDGLRLPDGVLADLGNRAMAAGAFETAIRAYTDLLARRGERPSGDGGPSDDFRLLLASLLIRHAGRPEEARPILARLVDRRLSDQAASLRDALLAEIDFGSSPS